MIKLLFFIAAGFLLADGATIPANITSSYAAYTSYVADLIDAIGIEKATVSNFRKKTLNYFQSMG